MDFGRTEWADPTYKPAVMNVADPAQCFVVQAQLGVVVHVFANRVR